MKAIDASVHDIWTHEDLLVETLVRRIDECGRYSPYNPEWQSLSTMIDYALKTKLAKKDVSRLLEKLATIGYVPLSRISSSPSIRLGWISLSEDGVIGLNVMQEVAQDGYGRDIVYDTCIDVFLTGECMPVFTVFLRGTFHDPDILVSPDSTMLAVLQENRLTVWGLADCRILLEVTIANSRGTRHILWSRDNSKVVIYSETYFDSIDVDLGKEERVCGKMLGRVDSIATNDDGTEFVYCDEEFLYYSSADTEMPVLLNNDLVYNTCLVLRSKEKFWAIIDNSVYQLADGRLEHHVDIDGSIDLTPRRFEEVLGDNMSDAFDGESFFGGGCTVEEDGEHLIFKNRLGQGRTHRFVISVEDLSYEKSVGGFEETRLNPFHGQDPIGIGPGLAYRIDRSQKKTFTFILIKDGKEIPLGRCRGNTVAAYAKGRLFVHKGRTVEVYDLQSMEMIRSILALDIDRWMYCGTDTKGVVSLVRLEDVVSVTGEGSYAKIQFARLKAPGFRLDVFQGGYIELDKVWNLKFSLAVRDNIVFFYKRDGNRVKPITLNRNTFKSGQMKRSTSRRTDASKFDARIDELSGERVAIVSMDDLDDNPNAEPRITIRIMDCNTGESELCDISKRGESGHLDVSGIGDSFVLREDGREYVVVQFRSSKTPLVCSRDADSRIQYPLEGGYVEGTVVSHDERSCVIRGEYGSFARYDARLQRLEDVAGPSESKKDIIGGLSSIPLNKEVRTSFGRIVQNGGAFFCLKN